MEKQLRKNVLTVVKAYYQELATAQRTTTYIPVSGKVLDEDDLLNMVEASLDMWLTTGRFNEEFERDFARYTGAKYALSTNSGSSANLLALSALTSHLLGDRRLQHGDEVLTVASGFPTTINPIIQHGLIPVFIDCELTTYNIDVDRIASAITPRTKAIMVAHTLGTPFNIARIQELCKEYNLWCIEDSCDALGGTYNNTMLGTFGDIGTYSFYPAHHMTMGEGGAVVTNNARLYKILLSFRDWGRDCWCPSGKDNTCKHRFSLQRGALPYGYDHKYTYSHVGFNLKITDWQAAIGCSQLKKVPMFLKQRTENAQYLLMLLSDCTSYFDLPCIPEHTAPAWFGFLLRVRTDAPFTKQALVEYIEQHNIGTRQLFAGNILRQPMMQYNSIPLRIEDGPLRYSNTLTEEEYTLLPNTETVMNSVFWIGVHPQLGKADLEYMSDTIHAFIKANT